MKTRLLALAFLAAPSVLLGTGCAAQPGYVGVEYPVHVHRHDPVGGVLAAAYLAASIAELAEATADTRATGGGEDVDPALDNTGDAARLLGPRLPAALPPPPPSAAHAEPAHAEAPPFDLGGAYGAIAHVDLSPCSSQGLARGYGHVELEFGNDGAPARVGLEMPAGSDPAARACVEESFSRVRVAAFDGAQASVRRAFYVSG